MSKTISVSPVRPAPLMCRETTRPARIHHVISSSAAPTSVSIITNVSPVLPAPLMCRATTRPARIHHVISPSAAPTSVSIITNVSPVLPACGARRAHRRPARIHHAIHRCVMRMNMSIITHVSHVLPAKQMPRMTMLRTRIQRAMIYIVDPTNAFKTMRVSRARQNITGPLETMPLASIPCVSRIQVVQHSHATNTMTLYPNSTVQMVHALPQTTVRVAH